MTPPFPSSDSPVWFCRILFMRISQTLTPPSVQAVAMQVPDGWKSTQFTNLGTQIHLIICYC